MLAACNIKRHYPYSPIVSQSINMKLIVNQMISGTVEKIDLCMKSTIDLSLLFLAN